MKIILAAREQDQALRDLARNSPMPGWVQLAFCREPDYFRGVDVEGESAQILAAMEGESLVGTGCRTIRSAYINGERMAIGYLSGLRIVPEAQRTLLLARGYRFLHALHEQDRNVPAYLTTIVEDNHKAISLLTSGRCGLPHYIDYGAINTYAIARRALRKQTTKASLIIRHGTEVPVEDLVEFLQREGAAKPFFPFVDKDKLLNQRSHGLSLGGFLVAYENDKVVGVVAGWNQRGCRQYLVHGYRKPVAFMRPWLNGCLRSFGACTLPPPGKQLNALYASFVCILDDNPEVLSQLLERMISERQGSDHPFVLIGLHENSPLNVAMNVFWTLKYRSRLFLVAWEDGFEFAKNIKTKKPPYLELALL